MSFSLFRGFFKRSGLASPLIPPPSLDPAESQFRSGLQFANGEGVAQDFAQALQFFLQAAEQNHAQAQYNVARMYGQGQGMRRDEAQSLMWLTRAANLGNAAAQYSLGVRQHLAWREGRTNAASEGRIEAFKWVRLSAAQGCRPAENACEFVTLSMTREEVTEGTRRATVFVPGPDH